MLKWTPEAAFKCCEFWVTSMFTWPPWPEDSRLKTILLDLLAWFFLSMSFVTLIALTVFTIERRSDTATLAKNLCYIVTISQPSIKILACRAQRDRFQVLLTQVRDFLKNMEPHERELLQRYVDRCAMFILIVHVAGLVTTSIALLGPLVLAQPLPVDGTYPFDVEHNPGRTIVYIQQLFAGAQCAALSPVDAQAALLVWYNGARFELLANEFERVTSLDQFKKCARQHQFLLKNTEEIRLAGRFVFLTSATMTTLSVIFGSIYVMSPSPIFLKVEFFFLVFCFAVVLFLSAWPAENLMHTSGLIGQAIYNSDWIQQSPEMRRNLQMVLQRSQRPAVIRVGCIIPRLSLGYYSDFLSKTFSFFTALRVMFSDSDEKT